VSIKFAKIMAQQLTAQKNEIVELLPPDLSRNEVEAIRAFLQALSEKRGQQKPQTVEEASVQYVSRSKEDQVVLTFPRNWLDDVWLAKILNWIEFKKLSERNQMTEAEAQAMGEQVKQDWWEKNQDWVLAKINKP